MMFRRSQDLAMVDILESEISSIKELKADSANQHMGSSNGNESCFNSFQYYFVINVHIGNTKYH